jgi:hypothetical protein
MDFGQPIELIAICQDVWRHSSLVLKFVIG